MGAIVSILEHAVWNYAAYLERHQRLFS